MDAIKLTTQFVKQKLINAEGGHDWFHIERVWKNAQLISDYEKGNKIADVTGIRAACKVMKTRFAKPFESVQFSSSTALIICYGIAIGKQSSVIISCYPILCMSCSKLLSYKMQ